MSSSDDAEVVETKILSDKKWLETLDKEELAYFQKKQISFEELEDRKVVCTACFKQGNHKQKVKFCLFFDRFICNLNLDGYKEIFAFIYLSF